MASIARNVAETFHIDFERITSAFADFDIVKWVIIESNSTDESSSVLKQYSEKFSWVHCESIKSPDATFPHRTQKLAQARNRCLEVFEDIHKEFKIDYLVVYDLNNLNNRLSKQGISSCKNLPNWGALTANQNGPYYDIWALRQSDWNDVDCWKRYESLVKFYPNKYLALWESVYSKMIKIPKYKDPIIVRSAFGGLAIYKTKFLKGCKYKGEDDAGDTVCEHVYFHQKFIENGGLIYINPALINTNYTDHSKRRKYYKFYILKYLLINN